MDICNPKHPWSMQPCSRGSLVGQANSGYLWHPEGPLLRIFRKHHLDVLVEKCSQPRPLVSDQRPDKLMLRDLSIAFGPKRNPVVCPASHQQRASVGLHSASEQRPPIVAMSSYEHPGTVSMRVPSIPMATDAALQLSKPRCSQLWILPGSKAAVSPRLTPTQKARPCILRFETQKPPRSRCS